MRGPTLKEMESPEFNKVWNAIKGWDISRVCPPDGRRLYAGATGTDVMTILDALGIVRHRSKHIRSKYRRIEL